MISRLYLVERNRSKSGSNLRAAIECRDQNGKSPQILRDVQTAKIEPQEIVDIVRDVAQRHNDGEKVSFGTYLVAAVMRYKDHPDQERSYYVSERLRCLSPLLNDERLRGWTIQGAERNSLYANGAVLRAVAKCPLRADSEKLWFDADEFFEMVLRETDSEGRA